MSPIVVISEDADNYNKMFNISNMSLKRWSTEVHQSNPKMMAGGYPYGYH